MAKSKTTATINALLKLASIPVKLGSGDDARDGDGVSVLVFETGDEAFAIKVENIEGVVDCPKITPLPNPPDGVVGVASVRGRMTLVMCLTADGTPGESRQRLILLKGDSQIGLFANRIEDVVSFAGNEWREALVGKEKGPPPAKGPTRRGLYFVHKERRIPVIDLESLIDVETRSSG